METKARCPLSSPGCWAEGRGVLGRGPQGSQGPGPEAAHSCCAWPRQGMGHRPSEDRPAEGWAACPLAAPRVGQGCPGSRAPAGSLCSPCQKLPFCRSCRRTWTSSLLPAEEDLAQDLYVGRPGGLLRQVGRARPLLLPHLPPASSTRRSQCGPGNWSRSFARDPRGGGDMSSYGLSLGSADCLKWGLAEFGKKCTWASCVR